MSRFVRIAAFMLAFLLVLPTVSASAKPLEEACPLTLTAPSVLLMEADTGTVIFEKNAAEKRPAASITKLMTLLLAFEAMEQGTLSLDTPVTVHQINRITLFSCKIWPFPFAIQQVCSIFAPKNVNRWQTTIWKSNTSSIRHARRLGKRPSSGIHR